MMNCSWFRRLPAVVILWFGLLTGSCSGTEVIVHDRANFAYFLSVCAFPEVHRRSLLPALFLDALPRKVPPELDRTFPGLEAFGKASGSFGAVSTLLVREAFTAASDAGFLRTVSGLMAAKGILLPEKHLAQVKNLWERAFSPISLKRKSATGVGGKSDLTLFRQAVGQVFQFWGWSKGGKNRRVFLCPVPVSDAMAASLQPLVSTWGEEIRDDQVIVLEVPVGRGKKAGEIALPIWSDLLVTLFDRLCRRELSAPAALAEIAVDPSEPGVKQVSDEVGEGNSPWELSMLPEALAAAVGECFPARFQALRADRGPIASDPATIVGITALAWAGELRPLVQKYLTAGLSVDRSFLISAGAAFRKTLPDAFSRPVFALSRVRIHALGFADPREASRAFLHALKEVVPLARETPNPFSDRWSTEIFLIRQGWNPSPKSQDSSPGSMTEAMLQRIQMMGGFNQRFFVDFPVPVLNFHQCVLVVPADLPFPRVLERLFADEQLPPAFYF